MARRQGLPLKLLGKQVENWPLARPPGGPTATAQLQLQPSTFWEQIPHRWAFRGSFMKGPPGCGWAGMACRGPPDGGQSPWVGSLWG